MTSSSNSLDQTSSVSNGDEIDYQIALDITQDSIGQRLGWVRDIRETNDNSLIVLGELPDNNNYGYIQKTDYQGTQKWLKTYTIGGSGLYIFAMVEDIFSNIYLGGKFSNGSGKFAYILKVDNEGIPIWNWTTSCTDISLGCYIQDLEIDHQDGNLFAIQYLYLGNNHQSHIFKKFSPDKTEVLTNNYTKEKTHHIRSLIARETGGFFIAGGVADGYSNHNDGFLAELSSDLHENWSMNYKYNVTDTANEVFTDLIETDDGGLAACGINGVGFWLITTDRQGNEINNTNINWDYRYHHCSDIVEKPQGGYLLYGYRYFTFESMLESRPVLIETDTNCNEMYIFTYETQMSVVGRRLFVLSDANILTVNFHETIQATANLLSFALLSRTPPLPPNTVTITVTEAQTETITETETRTALETSTETVTEITFDETIYTKYQNNSETILIIEGENTTITVSDTVSSDFTFIGSVIGLLFVAVYRVRKRK
ncbi:MAG: hypothetical protein ACXAD7_25295 [Candidatus Kariarchaeaceae archaeon]